MTTKFGWCIDGHHEGCVVWYRWDVGTTECSCTCHVGKDKPELKELAAEAPRKPSRARAASARPAPRSAGK